MKRAKKYEFDGWEMVVTGTIFSAIGGSVFFGWKGLVVLAGSMVLGALVLGLIEFLKIKKQNRDAYKKYARYRHTDSIEDMERDVSYKRCGAFTIESNSIQSLEQLINSISNPDADSIAIYKDWDVIEFELLKSRPESDEELQVRFERAVKRQKHEDKIREIRAEAGRKLNELD